MQISWRQLTNPALFWASVFGIGLLKPAPGTWGSVAALLFWWWVLSPLSVALQLAICVAYFLLSWWASSHVCRRFGVKDASQIVADEVVGMWLALALCPPVWWVALLAFLAFRLFDVWKPGPIGWLDRNVADGLGVMADDVLAGVLAGGLTLAVVWVIRASGISVI